MAGSQFVQGNCFAEPFLVVWAAGGGMGSWSGELGTAYRDAFDCSVDWAPGVVPPLSVIFPPS